MSKKLLVPDIGDFEELEVIEVLAKEGDQLNINDPVITIESDKSSVEIPSTINGKVEKVEVKVGDKVSKGDIILNIVSSGESVKNNPIPKDTESIIKQAEAAMEKQKDDITISQQTTSKKGTINYSGNQWQRYRSFRNTRLARVFVGSYFERWKSKSSFFN